MSDIVGSAISRAGEARLGQCAGMSLDSAADGVVPLASVGNGSVVRVVALRLLVVALVAAAVGVCVTSRGSAGTSPTRSCGTLAVGIGWYLRASPNVLCSSARRVIRADFSHGGNRKARVVVLGYVCRKRDLPDAEHIRCVRGARLVTAKSFGY